MLLEYIIETERRTEVYSECDVLVVGGGPAGFIAATAAARCGAKTILLERYGHLGGMGSGGLVLLIDSLCDGKGKILLKGLIEETIERLDKFGGLIKPPLEKIGSSKSEDVRYWGRLGADGGGPTVRYSPVVDPEMFKVVANDMVLSSDVKLILHSWGVGVLKDGPLIKGVIFESKTGRKAIRAKIVVDCTGDGDIAALAGAEFVEGKLPLGLVFRVGNVDTKKSEEFLLNKPEALEPLKNELRKANITHGAYGFAKQMPGIYMLSSRDSIVWFNNVYPGNALDVADLTKVEVSIRQAMMIVVEFYRKHIPGFENAFVIDTASQIGTRASRRIIGEHVIQIKEFLQGTRYEDEICVLQPPYRGFSPSDPYKAIPYRALVPKQIDNLIIAGRCLSSDFGAQEVLRIIPPCMATGQAAGTAASLAVSQGVTPRNLDVGILRKKLIDQGVLLNA
jgi:hypothetical protein